MTKTLVQFRVEELLQAYRDRPAAVRSQSRFTISSQLEPEGLTSAIEQLGWRVCATNQVAVALSLPQAVEAYRDEYLVERNFGRLKGRPLSLFRCMSSATIMRPVWFDCYRWRCAS